MFVRAYYLFDEGLQLVLCYRCCPFFACIRNINWFDIEKTSKLRQSPFFCINRNPEKSISDAGLYSIYKWTDNEQKWEFLSWEFLS